MAGNLDKYKERLNEVFSEIQEVEMQYTCRKELIDNMTDNFGGYDKWKDMQMSELDPGVEWDDNYTVGDFNEETKHLEGRKYQLMSEYSRLQGELIRQAQTNYDITRVIGLMKGDGETFDEIVKWVSSVDPTYFKGRYDFNLGEDYEEASEALSSGGYYIDGINLNEEIGSLQDKFERDMGNDILLKNLQTFSEQYQCDMEATYYKREKANAEHELDNILNSGDVHPEFTLDDAEEQSEILRDKIFESNQKLRMANEKFKAFDFVYESNLEEEDLDNSKTSQKDKSELEN